MSEDKVMLPLTGRHLRIWGSGHTCSSDETHDTCVCECGVPYEVMPDE